MRVVSVCEDLKIVELLMERIVMRMMVFMILGRIDILVLMIVIMKGEVLVLVLELLFFVS